MAYKNKIIQNPGSGQEIRFLQTSSDTGGRLLEMEATWRPGSTEPAMHYHPAQQEEFIVLEGELTVRIKGQLLVLKGGDKLTIPCKQPHSMWNDSSAKTVVNWKVTPALETEELLETGMGLARDGKVNSSGMPGLLQAALTAKRFSNVYRLAKPPFPVQRVLFFFLTPIALLLGYRALYSKYIN